MYVYLYMSLCVYVYEVANIGDWGTRKVGI